jgi:hypothetical protein
MYCHPLRGLLLVGACAAALSAVSAPDDRPVKGSDAKTSVSVRPVDAPPEQFAAALADLMGTDAGKRKKAASALAALRDAEPYVRHYASTDRGKSNAFAAEVMDEFEIRRAERNVDRAAGWAKEGRYDLLVDVCLHSDTDQLKTVGRAFFDFFARVNSLPKEVRGKGFAPQLGFTIKSLDRQQDVRLFHEKAGVLKTDYYFPALVRARACEPSARTRFYWLVLTREHLKGTDIPGNQWENCCIFHNSDLKLDDLMTSLVVCDGDVEAVTEWFTSSSLIIANGTIRGKGGVGGRGVGGTGSTYFAGGDIVASSNLKHDNLFLAGGSIIDVKTGKARTGVENEKPGQKENPFGVRFFATTDVGVELAVKDDAVTVAKLTPGSPLTKYGVQVGDVITQVNDKAAKTANDVRRELRYSVVLEAGIFHIRRGDEKLTRVVYFKNGLEK